MFYTERQQLINISCSGPKVKLSHTKKGSHNNGQGGKTYEPRSQESGAQFFIYEYCIQQMQANRKQKTACAV